MLLLMEAYSYFYVFVGGLELTIIVAFATYHGLGHLYCKNMKYAGLWVILGLSIVGEFLIPVWFLASILSVLTVLTLWIFVPSAFVDQSTIREEWRQRRADRLS